MCKCGDLPTRAGMNVRKFGWTRVRSGSRVICCPSTGWTKLSLSRCGSRESERSGESIFELFRSRLDV